MSPFLHTDEFNKISKAVCSMFLLVLLSDASFACAVLMLSVDPSAVSAPGLASFTEAFPATRVNNPEPIPQITNHQTQVVQRLPVFPCSYPTVPSTQGHMGTFEVTLAVSTQQLPHRRCKTWIQP